MPSLLRLLIMLGVLTAVYFFVMQSFAGERDGTIEYSYTQLKEQVRNGHVHSVTIQGQQIRGWLKAPSTPPDERPNFRPL